MYNKTTKINISFSFLPNDFARTEFISTRILEGWVFGTTSLAASAAPHTKGYWQVEDNAQWRWERELVIEPVDHLKSLELSHLLLLFLDLIKSVAET